MVVLIVVMICVIAFAQIKHDYFRKEHGENIWIIITSDRRWMNFHGGFWTAFIFHIMQDRQYKLEGLEYTAFFLFVLTNARTAATLYLMSLEHKFRVAQAHRDLAAGYAGPRPLVEINPAPARAEYIPPAASALPSSAPNGFEFDPDRFKKKSVPDLPDLTNWKLSDEK